MVQLVQEGRSAQKELSRQTHAHTHTPHAHTTHAHAHAHAQAHAHVHDHAHARAHAHARTNLTTPQVSLRYRNDNSPKEPRAHAKGPDKHLPMTKLKKHVSIYTSHVSITQFMFQSCYTKLMFQSQHFNSTPFLSD